MDHWFLYDKNKAPYSCAFGPMVDCRSETVAS